MKEKLYSIKKNKVNLIIAHLLISKILYTKYIIYVSKTCVDSIIYTLLQEKSKLVYITILPLLKLMLIFVP